MKAWTALIFSAALAIAGAVPVLGFLAVFIWQLAKLFLTRAWTPMPASMYFPPDLHPSVLLVLGKLHAGAVPAILGLALLGLGLLGTHRNLRVLRARKQAREDRKRRVQDYRLNPADDTVDGRREPFLGTVEPRVPRRANAR